MPEMDIQTGPRARIISFNQEGEAICASAARISTTQGSADEIFEAARGSEKNRALISKVLRSGHKSTLEHAVFTLSMRNVSVYVEQFFIESRLASFTVKSRRYVDFGGFGYYVPPELEGQDLTAYRLYMDRLFAAYRDLLDLGVPKEDARFLLPYSFYSNFYCTLNARELAAIIRQMRCGRGSHVPELQNIADQLTKQLESLFPALLPELAGNRKPPVPPPSHHPDSLPDTPVFISQSEAGAVQLLSAPAKPLEMLRMAHRAACPLSDDVLDLKALLQSQRPRELEQLPYTFLLSGVTLSGVTHIVRHRMQSVIVPPIESVVQGRYIVPDTVARDPAALSCYRAALETAYGTVQELSPVLRRYGYHYALSGGLMDLMTTMNARELLHFMRLRTCNRAQWEIRAIATEMLRQLRGSFRELFGLYGPSCYLSGRCPEGTLSCGKIEEVSAKFGQEL